ncbi:MAG TPA: hypothetical protein VD906_06860 [Caulobacteraceae bacterium]|nr:hypothetical protein [Caulobacteraceae bacterium]
MSTSVEACGEFAAEPWPISHTALRKTAFFTEPRTFGMAVTKRW